MVKKKEEEKQPKDISREKIDEILKEEPESISDEYLDLTKKPKAREEIKETDTKEEIKNLDIPPRKPPIQAKPIEPEKQPFYEPTFPQENPTPQRLPTTSRIETNPKNILVRNMIIGASIIFLVFIISFVAYSFSQKDFSPKVDITNNAPDIPVVVNSTNNYDHTILNNQTIIIQIDEDIIQEVVDRILDKLNETNSS